jgi:hypothetical protein
MTFILADRVKESSTTTGTGSYVLAGALSNFQAFSSKMANNDECYYHAVDDGGSGFEVGVGRWTTGGNLVRLEIFDSSNSGAAVSWSAGTRTISIGLPAAAAIPSKIRYKNFTFAGSRTSVFDFTAFAANEAMPTLVMGQKLKMRLLVNQSGSHNIYIVLTNGTNGYLAQVDTSTQAISIYRYAGGGTYNQICAAAGNSAVIGTGRQEFIWEFFVTDGSTNGMTFASQGGNSGTKPGFTNHYDMTTGTWSLFVDANAAADLLGLRLEIDP